LVHYLDHYKK